MDNSNVEKDMTNTDIEVTEDVVTELKLEYNQIVIKVQEKEKEIKTLEKDIQAKMEQITNGEKEVEKVNALLQDIDNDIERKKSDRKNIQKEIDSLNDELKELNRKISEIDDEIEGKYQENNEIITRKNKDCKEYCDRLVETAKEKAKQVESEAKSKLKEADKKISEAVLLEKELSEREMKVEEKEKSVINDFILEKSSISERYDKDIQEKRLELEKRTIELESELAKHRAQLISEIEEELRVKREQFNLEKESFEQMVADFNEEMRESEEIRINLEQREAEVSRKEKALESVIKQRVAVAHSSLMQELEDAKEMCDKFSADYSKANKEILALRQLQKNDTPENIAILTKLNESYKKDIEQYIKQIDNSVDMAKYQSIKDKADKYDSLLSDYNDIVKEKQDLENSLMKVAGEEETIRNLETLNQQLTEDNEKLREALEVASKKKITYSEKIKSVTTGYFENTSNVDYIEPTTCTEMEWLDEIKKQTEKDGIKINSRLFEAYHTSLKNSSWSPLTVLAGVSGTGKSELPGKYAKHGGLNFLPIPVKPDWDSPQSLFGFFNSVENRFEAQDVLKVLNQMSDQQSEFYNQMSIILLDEMNLAHVELYFSDLLSKLESRRDNPGVYLPFSLGEDDDLRVKLSPNVLWTGTMNEDETTKSLSDKVIDRSTLITFPRPHELFSRPVNKNQVEGRFSSSKLHRKTWTQWYAKNMLNKANDSYGPFSEKIDYYRGIIQDINDALAISGRALGHRVWQGIEQYMAHYPRLIDQFYKTGKLDEDIMNQAFAEAVAFKVMPKLRGLETKGAIPEKCLDDIGVVINSKIKNLQDDYENARTHVSKLFQWNSAKFLEL